MRLAGPSLLAALSCAALCGCPDPNLYTTPRTLEPGTIQIQIAEDALGALFNQTSQGANGATQTKAVTLYTPLLPTVGVRYGLLDGLELGARLASFGTLSGDAKVRLLRGTVDLAIDPGLQFLYVGGAYSSESAGAAVLYASVPLLVGVNVSQDVSIVASPGIAYGVVTTNINDGSNDIESAMSSSGFIGRLGVGVNLRVKPALSLQPELTFTRALQGNDALIYVLGFGLNIGAQPDYSDLAR